MTRQAISPRFAIRIRLNMFFLLELLAGSSPAMWHAGTRVTNPSYSKNRERQRSRIGSRREGGGRGLISAGIALKTAARIGARDRLHQLADLGFQIFIGYDPRADGRAQIAAAGRDRLVDGGFQPVMVPGIGLRRRGHDSVPCWGNVGICSYFVLPKSMRRLDDNRGYSGTFFFRRKKRNQSMMTSKASLRTNSNMVRHPFGGAMDALLPGHGPFFRCDLPHALAWSWSYDANLC